MTTCTEGTDTGDDSDIAVPSFSKGLLMQQYTYPITHVPKDSSTFRFILFNTLDCVDKSVCGKFEEFEKDAPFLSDDLEDLIKTKMEQKFEGSIKVGQFKSVSGIPQVILTTQLLCTCKWYVIIYDEEDEYISAILPKMAFGTSVTDVISKITYPNELMCIRFPRNGHVQDMLTIIESELNKELEAENKLHLFHSSKKLFAENTFNKVSSNEVFLMPMKERKKHLKILHSVDHNKDEILHVNCLSTDSVLEIRKRFLQDHFHELEGDQFAVFFSRPLSNSLLSEDDAVNKALFTSTQKTRKDVYQIVSGSESEDDDLFRIVDLIVHIGVKGCIGVTVKYTKSHQFRKSKLALIDRSGSTENLRHQIGKILHQDPLCLKLSIGGKDVPEMNSLSTIKELKSGCLINAKIKSKVDLRVEGDKQVERIDAKIMERVSDIKERVALLIQLPVRMFELSHAGSLLIDQCTLDEYNIESEAVLQLASIEKRIQIHVKNMTSEINNKVSVKPKFESLSVDDPAHTTVSGLKETLGNILAIKPDRLVLVHGGQDITKEGTIKEAGIKDGDTITVSTTKRTSNQKGPVLRQTKSQENTTSDFTSGRGRLAFSGDFSDNGSLEVELQSEEDIAADGNRNCTKVPSIIRNYSRHSDTEVGFTRQRKSLSSLNIPIEVLSQLPSSISTFMDKSFSKSNSSEQCEYGTDNDMTGEDIPRRRAGHVRSYSEGQRENIISTNIKAKVTSCSGNRKTLREFHYVESDISSRGASISESCEMHHGKRDPLDKIFQTVAKEIHGQRWKFLGRRLGVSENNICDIDSNARESSEKVYQMLVIWRSQEGKEASTEKLKKALKEENENYVIEKMEVLEQTFTEN